MSYDFEIIWWIPNLLLMVYPIYFIIKILKGRLN
ncbi:YvaD family protein [Clostridium estertheticum]|nr:YvaD family protein [Clostridium estertheticum]MBX4271802.1 YvaD family protein [Clostridium estertheticum]WLC82284.1 YvaD family protein [Clostridium estertheticum]WLC91026.1 YvaD family protein [Clostridium estertheticum]